MARPDREPASEVGTALISRHHARRLRSYYRSAGWPYHDNVEIDLLNAGLIERVRATGSLSPDCIRVTEAGVRALGTSLAANRGAFDAHEALVERIARHASAAGRLVYRGLTLRGSVGAGWKLCRPDVFSLRYSSVAAYTEPVIHEVKVRRADLLADLRNPDKRAAYHALSSALYYVLPDGLAKPEEIPDDCGVLLATTQGLVMARASPRRAVEPGHAVWMALARRAAEPVEQDEAQAWLGDFASEGSP